MSGHLCGDGGPCESCSARAEDRAAGREAVEVAPPSDPRSRFGDVRDWNWPSGFGGGAW